MIQLVNSSGNIVEFDNSNIFYSGANSEIFEIDKSTLLKVPILSPKGISISPLKPNDFDLLKKINHENFVNLNERYNRVPQTSENVEAYTYERIIGDTYNLLFRRTDFMIDQFNNISNLYDVFLDEGIAVIDAHADNSVVLKTRIVITDPDLYRSIDNKELVLSRNKFEFIGLIKSYFIYDWCATKRRLELLDGLGKEKEPVKTLEKRLKGYKYPYEYFYNKNS